MGQNATLGTREERGTVTSVSSGPEPGTEDDLGVSSGLEQNAGDEERGEKSTIAGDGDVDEAELRIIDEMKRRDREVRAHEQAHKAAGGAYAGAISLSFERGPDGKNYAVGGSVSIDVAPVPNDPEATIQKMRQVQAAALAPASPSAPDRRIAAIAARTIALATAELTQQRQKEQTGTEGEPRPTQAVTHIVA